MPLEDPFRADALAAVAGDLHDETVGPPPGVLVSSRRFALSALPLDDKHQSSAAKLAGPTVDALR